MTAESVNVVAADAVAAIANVKTASKLAMITQLHKTMTMKTLSARPPQKKATSSRAANRGAADAVDATVAVTAMVAKK